jgi:cobalt/nickel transport system permease protein
MGALLTRSFEMSNEVYLAMQSRGYRGEVQVLDDLRWQNADWLALLGFLVVAAGAVWVGR